MANYGAKILNIATRSLSAQQAVIANTSNNIANANTPGYSRRVVDLETSQERQVGGSGIQIGNGVTVAGVRRIADEYIDKLLQSALGREASSGLQNDFLTRVDRLFSLTGDTATIATNLNSFFTALNDLSANPASIELRKNVLERAGDLVTSISTTYNEIANLQDEANSRISTEIDTVNSITSQIAQLNSNISTLERAGGTASDDRDRRAELLQQLSQKLSFQSVEASDGAINVYLPNGFSLVNGGSNYELETTTAPSFGATPPQSLSGGVLSYVVYDYSGGAGTQHLDLTEYIKDGDGSIGALLKLRGYNDPSNTSPFQADGVLVEIASRIESLSRDLLTRFNTAYLGPDEDSGTAGFQPSALDLNGNTPAVYGLFDFTYTGTKDVDSDGTPDDLAALDAAGVKNFSSRLSVAFSDPRRFAAARDVNATGGATTLVAGDAGNLLGNGTATPGLIQLQGTSASFTTGSFSFTGTYEELYNETVTHVSSAKRTAQSRADLDSDSVVAIQNQRDEISAVSMDEEFASLIKFQKAYQASAKMIKVADEMLSTIIGLL